MKRNDETEQWGYRWKNPDGMLVPALKGRPAMLILAIECIVLDAELEEFYQDFELQKSQSSLHLLHQKRRVCDLCLFLLSPTSKS